MSASTTPSPAYWGEKPHLLALRDSLAAREHDPAGRAWREIGPQVRTALVMLALDVEGDHREYARRPWASYSDSERAALGAIARQFSRELAGAGVLR